MHRCIPGLHLETAPYPILWPPVGFALTYCTVPIICLFLPLSMSQPTSRHYWKLGAPSGLDFCTGGNKLVHCNKRWHPNLNKGIDVAGIQEPDIFL